jgi:hypothetical protein
MLEANSKCCKD